MNDVPIVGGKNASLGEMVSSLTELGVNVPKGFATTAEAYFHFLQHNNLIAEIDSILENLDTRDLKQLSHAGAHIREAIVHGDIPEDLATEIGSAYQDLIKEYGSNPDVAVRSSATAEDLPSASFAGQQETYLNIRGLQNLILTCKRVFASLYTNRAISYRKDKGFDHKQLALSIGIQKMVRADLASSGVIFTLDTETGFKDVIFITSAYGLGENIVQGKVNPDEFYVFKPSLKKGLHAILKRHRGEKAIKMICTTDGLPGTSTHNVRVQREERERFSINDEEVTTLANYASIIEDHYSKLAGKFTPMDIEWAKDGESGELYIVQARPETVQSQAIHNQYERYRLKQQANVICTGKSVGRKIACGKVRVILETADMHLLQAGEILVTDITDPDWEPIMKIASAIVTNRGGRTCHAAIIARELGIPAIVGSSGATQTLRTGQEITVCCAQGDTGYVYEGCLDFEIEKQDFTKIKRPHTDIMINLGNPEQAFESSSLPCQGVGLARLEFIINHYIGVHPQALIEFDRLSEQEQEKIEHLCAGYADRRHYYIQRLAEGISIICAAFYPRPVIVRLSDFKSNEYASLLGGKHFEPKEENPMIGFRGASRYPSEQFAESFSMECSALLEVRNNMGLDNLAVMIPFVRTVSEAKAVLEQMRSLGLERGKDNLKIYQMCELPANALLAEEFLEYFDGFSIGSNDLTQLTLGIDRDSNILGEGYDERNAAVLALIEMAITACKKHNKYVGICGQAPSDFPEITKWLVKQNIDSISLNPDSVLPMTEIILQEEKLNT